MKKNMTKSGAIHSRYSNLTTNDYSTGGLQGGESGTSSTGSGTFDWNGLVQGVLNLGNTFVSSFWNNGAQTQANYTNELYKQEQRTNTILWVIIGLVLALGIFLIIRKAK